MNYSYLERVTISGSYRKFPELVGSAIEQFRGLGVDVLSPKSSEILASVDGFVSLRGDLVQRIDQVPENSLTDAMRFIENSHLRAIQQSDALWLIIPGGYVGVSTAFEAGWALAHNIPVFYDRIYREDMKEPIIRAYACPTEIERLVADFSSMPKVDPLVSRYFQQHLTQARLQDYNPHTENNSRTLNSPLNATISVGPFILYVGERSQPTPLMLVVDTYKWATGQSIVGGRMIPGETLDGALLRVVSEQTGLECSLGPAVGTFDEIPGSGYFISGTKRVFHDRTVVVHSLDVSLDRRARSFKWLPVDEAIPLLEPNARRSAEIVKGMIAAQPEIFMNL
jgi:ADP-ribose pyrophosphatase YjhB (NUDIX family)/nucleoside 2-deoxyribosyltransferase